MKRVHSIQLIPSRTVHAFQRVMWWCTSLQIWQHTEQKGKKECGCKLQFSLEFCSSKCHSACALYDACALYRVDGIPKLSVPGCPQSQLFPFSSLTYTPMPTAVSAKSSWGL